ncbi:hypothetical protein LRB11_17410, partial [Ectothiorhodospira haloalkaliphila]|uniref:hypothetical protein n=1 Tax=Ectothiorhodospira haloalkaliphila TaxID=421628 RepID=UPI001EE8984E
LPPLNPKMEFLGLYQDRRKGEVGPTIRFRARQDKREGLLESGIGALIGLGGVAEDVRAGEDLSTGFVGGPQGGEWHQDDLELLFTHK